MSTKVAIIAHSRSPDGKEIITYSLEYWRAFHAELMTHRDFSRNASSSRAIPVMKMIRRVIDDPAGPLHWGSNRPGMQATEQLTGWRLWLAKKAFYLARYPAVVAALVAVWIGLHKQVANRLLEPWMYISVVLTATELGNWFNLRYHPDAMPEIQELARLMWEAKKASKPRRCGYGQWHLPYIGDAEKLRFPIDILLKISAARCARVSYLTHEGKIPRADEDVALFFKLMGGNPKHASPTEHQARPMESFADLDLGGNLKGWVQHRKLIPGEYAPDFQGPTT